MSLHDDMHAALATVPAALGVTWQMRNRTSAPTEAPTFDAWGDVSVLPLGNQDRSQTEEHGEDLVTSIMLRMSVTISVSIGDQFKDPDGNHWHAAEQMGSGVGTKRWICERAQRSAFGDVRGGGS